MLFSVVLIANPCFPSPQLIYISTKYKASVSSPPRYSINTHSLNVTKCFTLCWNPKAISLACASIKNNFRLVSLTVFDKAQSPGAFQWCSMSGHKLTGIWKHRVTITAWKSNTLCPNIVFFLTEPCSAQAEPSAWLHRCYSRPCFIYAAAVFGWARLGKRAL